MYFFGSFGSCQWSLSLHRFPGFCLCLVKNRIQSIKWSYDIVMFLFLTYCPVRNNYRASFFLIWFSFPDSISKFNHILLVGIERNVISWMMQCWSQIDELNVHHVKHFFNHVWACWGFQLTATFITRFIHSALLFVHNLLVPKRLFAAFTNSRTIGLKLCSVYFRNWG